MKTLEDKITESGCEALKGIIKVLQDNGFEITVKNTEPIDDLLPEFKLSKSIFDKLSDLPQGEKDDVPFYLQDWREIKYNSEEYVDVLYKTQELVPVDSGNSLHCYHSDYNLDGNLYRLTWGFGDTAEDKPTIQKKFS